MKIFNNVTDIVRDDMAENIKKGSKVSIAAACFSMYAYKELKSATSYADIEWKFSIWSSNDDKRTAKSKYLSIREWI